MKPKYLVFAAIISYAGLIAEVSAAQHPDGSFARAQGDPVAVQPMPENGKPCSLSLQLSGTLIEYNVTSPGDHSAEIRIDLVSNKQLAIYLDTDESSVDAYALDRFTIYPGGPLVSKSKTGPCKILMDWSVKSLTGDEYPDWTPCSPSHERHSGKKQRNGWRFPKSTPGHVAISLRNTIHVEPVTPPGDYQKEVTIVVSPVL